ncbi:MAG TPA: 7-cyano-7-deazaguanine synthase [Candidatus Polarisedimenticolia bacterium]|nr:7-cyano-7-deazaguanine synthase [Candidatus Polarisedimenticolia bacterium]
MPRAVVVLSSGGLDSAVLIARMARRGLDVHPVFVKAGLIWERAELAALRRYLRGLPPGLARRVRPPAVLSLPLGDLYGRHWSTTGKGTPAWSATDDAVYLPGRNLLLLAKAGVLAAMRGVPRLAIGPLKGNPFPDASPAFFRAMQKALAEGLDFPLRIEAPLLSCDKEDLIRGSAGLPLGLTLSCSRPSGSRPCGRCAKCRERILALRAVAAVREDGPGAAPRRARVRARG